MNKTQTESPIFTVGPNALPEMIERFRRAWRGLLMRVILDPLGDHREARRRVIEVAVEIALHTAEANHGEG